MAVQVIPITDFRKESREILGRLGEKPVVLTQRSRPVAVLVEYDKYIEQEERMQQLELMLDDTLLSQAIRTAEDFVSLEDLFADDHSS